KHRLSSPLGRPPDVKGVSDQKPLGSWSVKQTQAISCPAIYNSQTKEYVVVHDKKVLRIWKDEDVNLEKVFKATLLADVCRIHMLPDTEPLVLFEGGAVRRLDVLLTDPQQEIEDIVSEGEVISIDGQFLPIWILIINVNTDMCLTFISESLSIWNTTFQTLLTWKELPEGSCGQLWCYSGKLYVPHGKVLTVVPFTCETSSLAAVLGKLQQPNTAEMKTAFTVVNWNALLYDEEAEGLQQAAARSGAKLEPKRIVRRETLLRVLSQTGTLEKVEEDLHIFFNNLQSPNTQLITAQITTKLVHRCLEEVKFYPQKALVQLLQTQVLSYSLCPDLVAVALSKADYFLLQLCLQQFPDIPEAVTCACLKLFLSVSDSDLQDVTLDFGDVACYIDIENQSPQHTETPEVVQNGFSPGLLENSCDLPLPPVKSHQPPAFDVNSKCPVSLQKAALLNEILLSSYSETFLLPHLKDLSAPQVMLFLQYMKYLYVKYSETVNTELPGERVPTVNQVLDWISLLLDAHFTLLVMTPEARGLLTHLHKFVRSQVKFYSELSKIEGSIQGLHQVKPLSYDSRYSIEVIKLF
uniref:Nucleolar protein 11 n=1 Tax=Callorhinchus milii TaxID=7868 RepID=A0A4W3KAK6_CALMI